MSIYMVRGWFESMSDPRGVRSDWCEVYADTPGEAAEEYVKDKVRCGATWYFVSFEVFALDACTVVRAERVTRVEYVEAPAGAKP